MEKSCATVSLMLLNRTGVHQCNGTPRPDLGISKFDAPAEVLCTTCRSTLGKNIFIDSQDRA
jgi:hypothetical protein